ncbi:hypothetical protein BZZ01_08765 [Nostocales cyanobacterium HT-58-2]|nr:hypothetical protein BZZ01_08765 [Nostocales cyanobacterium HT-58-2]
MSASSTYIAQANQSAQPVPQQSFTAANNLKITVKQVTPYNQETDLQILCFFKHKASGDKVLSAIADLDKQLGGVISSLRNSGDFVGNELETLWFVPPSNSIKPKTVLLIGLGDEQTLSLEKMHRIGTVALREAVKLKATRVSFAPGLRDQGNAKLDTGDVASAVIQNVILAYNTEKQLQKQGLAQPFTINEWVIEAGPDYYKQTVAKIEQGVALANNKVATRKPVSYITNRSLA